MQLTLSSKGQIVLPAPMRRRLHLKARSMLEIVERDGGLFLRPAETLPAFEPINYPPAGSMKLSKWDYELDKLAGPDFCPDDV